MTERLTKPVRLWQLVPDADKARAGEPVTAAGGRLVEDPCDVAFVGPYSFVVADSVGHRLVLVDIARNVCSTIADQQVWPNGVAATADGKLLVTDRRTKVRNADDTHSSNFLYKSHAMPYLIPSSFLSVGDHGYSHR